MEGKVLFEFIEYFIQYRYEIINPRFVPITSSLYATNKNWICGKVVTPPVNIVLENITHKLFPHRDIFGTRPEKPSGKRVIGFSVMILGIMCFHSEAPPKSTGNS